MDYIEDWVDRAMSCFYRDRDKDDPGKQHVHDDVIFAPAPLDPAKIDKDFECLVKELGLNEEKQQEMHNYSMEKKMSLLVSQHCLQTEDASHFIGFLKNLQQSFVIDSNTIRQLQELVISLRTQNYSYLESFISSSGLKLLTELLNQCHQQYTLEQPALFFLYALRALLNSPNGRVAVLNDEQHVLVSIARAVDFRDFKCKIVAIEILSGLCFIPDEGHIQVLRAITEVSTLLGERTRFQTLVSDLHRTYSTDRDTDRVRTAIFGLINALLRTGAAENCAIYRQHLRSELLMLGMSTTLEQCREGASQRLEDHIDLFEMMRKEDEISLAGSCTSSDISMSSETSSPIDFESVVGMAEALHIKLNHSQALPHFHSLLQHLFMVPSDDQHVPLWRLFDLILQHLTLQTTVNGMTDVNSPLQNHVDMSEILARLQNHCDYERIAKELEKAKEDMDLERTRIMELENRLADFSDGRAGSRISLASTSASSSPSDPCPSPPLLPPVCPPAPPPPPPPIGGLTSPPKDALKNVPEPPGNMKTLNWQRLTLDKTRGTVWDGIDDEKIYKQLDLTELSGCFAASSSHKDEDTDTLYGTINRRPQQANITVIDPRRYQNCTIMLSKLKLSHKEIKQAMMSMDEKCKLPKDMIEQMLKFMPTKEELTQINESVQKHGSPTVLALADRYMYEISSIPRFEQRLRCLNIIRSFHDRVEALVPFIQVVLKATSSCQQNKRFRQILTIILAIGNYLNFGKRNGNAYGFEMASINKLADVKNALRNDRNLLHFLVNFIEKKYPDLTKFKKDFATVTEAARFSQSETAAEIRNLEEALLIVRKELNLLESTTKVELPEHIPPENDRFALVAKAFIEKATAEYHNLDKMFREMKNKFSDCAKYFCYSPSGGVPVPEEFFSVINKFLNTFNEYHQQLWAEVEEEEKIKRQTIARSFLAKKSTTRRKENHKERDFEQLISALQSGDIFKEELSRLRTSFRPKKTVKP
ncbi:FH2 domain-containing protein [Caenorhabditis elegans]|uniref:FH2 domain-containing protein n=2 Tax=Caenorhabditis elegans TaxID=6239 RepID=D6VPA1_CAEEL|nr:FH2 domain-containing protein [Caenorhabditis elegans]CCD71975.1 FH2 domain-containing protein [Caenorhabditis elegans]|eukprot:NP_503132.3 DAAM (Disheveled-Associated Activator of Morphogenesis) homolog [Caenorhabditis elegans]